MKYPKSKPKGQWKQPLQPNNWPKMPLTNLKQEGINSLKRDFMRKMLGFIGLFLLMLLTAEPLIADDSTMASPWEKISINAGAFLAYSSTDVRFGTDLGIDVNLEDALGLDIENKVFRIEGYWRFSDNRRHRLDLSWYSLNRTGTRTISEDITVSPPEGEDILIPLGATVKTEFDLDIYQAVYSYSFLQDDRLDFAVQGGLYIMPISFGLSVTGILDGEADQSFIAPLPVMGLKMDLLIAPKWYLRSGVQLFFIKYENYTGSLLNHRTAIEYNPWKHVGFGLGIDTLRLQLEADGGEDYTGMDLRGNVDFGYSGVLLYGRLFF